ALVGITAGLGESGEDGLARQRALVERVRAHGAMLLGPNCLGVFDASSELGLASNEFPAGRIGLISQSGNLALELGLLAGAAGLGFSRFASIGNQADLDLAELVSSFALHEHTHAIGVYVEDFLDGRAFVEAAAAAGKPLVLLTVGRSEASVRAARSHTGALVSHLAVVEAACRASGARLVSTPAAMIDTLQALLTRPRLAGRRIAVVSDGGGHGAIACDSVADAGLALPALSDRLAADLAGLLPETAATGNPIDLAGGGERDFHSYSQVARRLLESDEVDGVILTGYFGGYSQYSEEFERLEVEVAGEVAAAAAETGRPLVVQTMYAVSPTAAALREGGVAVYATIEAATAALAALVETGPPPGAPPLPEPQPGDLHDDYFAARGLLAAAGVPFVQASRVRTHDEVRATAAAFGYPLVLKALGTLHKSDAGGVIVGIEDDDALEMAFHDLLARLAPPELSLERMAPPAAGVELIVGARRDPRFGPVALVGLGGIHAEMFRDVAIGLAPVTPAEAERMLRSLRGAPLLDAARGRPAVDVAAAARAAAALSLLAAQRPDIAEMEVNPLLVTPDGAIGLDARIIPVGRGDGNAD
ncbi:MAG: acetate--CoA ligase family protein, partial [Gaiellales bacterium]